MAALSPAGQMIFGDQSQTTLADQVQGETEEMRRRRLAALQASKALPTGSNNPAQNMGVALSSAGAMLLNGKY